MTDTLSAKYSRSRDRWKLLFRILAGAALVSFLAIRTDWQPVAAALQGLAWGHWLAAAAIYLVSQFVSAWRWGVLSRPLGFRFPQRRFLQLYFEGMFFSLCLPSSIGGDVLKAYRLAPTASGRVLAGCTVLADRATGLIGLMVIGLSGLAARSFALTLWPAVGMGAALLVATLTAVTIGLKVLGRISRLFSCTSKLGRFAAQLGPYYSRPAVFRSAIGWGFLVQWLSVFAVAQIGAAMGLSLPLSAYCISVPIVALLTMLPVSISGVGVREGGMAWMLSTYGVPSALGVTLGMLWFLVTVVGGLVGGVVYMASGKEERPLAVAADSLAPQNSLQSTTETALSRRQAA